METSCYFSWAAKQTLSSPLVDKAFVRYEELGRFSSYIAPPSSPNFFVSFLYNLLTSMLNVRLQSFYQILAV